MDRPLTTGWSHGGNILAKGGRLETTTAQPMTAYTCSRRLGRPTKPRATMLPASVLDVKVVRVVKESMAVQAGRQGRHLSLGMWKPWRRRSRVL